MRSRGKRRCFSLTPEQNLHHVAAVSSASPSHGCFACFARYTATEIAGKVLCSKVMVCHEGPQSANQFEGSLS